MLKCPSESLSSYHTGPDDALDDWYLTHTSDVPPPALRAKRLFPGPEQGMPAMDVVLSEYAWPRGACAQRGAPAASSSARPRPCKLDERTLSDGFRAQSQSRSRDASSGSGSGWSLLYYPCSPLARDDTVGSPLQASIDAHAARDRSPSLPPSTVPAHAVETGSRRRRATRSTRSSAHDGIGSVDSAETPPLSFCTAGSRSAVRRQQNASWSPDGTVVAPASWLSGADRDGVFEACNSKPGLTKGQERRGLDGEGDLGGYADAQERERNADPGGKEENWDAVHDERYPTDNSQSLPTAYADPPSIASTTTNRPWFQRRRPSTTRTYARESSLIPSFYSDEEDGGPSSSSALDDGRATCGNGKGRAHGVVGTAASAVRRRYVAVSYKVRLAVFRTERRVGRGLSWQRGRRGEKEEEDGGDV